MQEAVRRGSFLFDGGWVDRAIRWEIVVLHALAWHEMDIGSADGAILAKHIADPERLLGNLNDARALMLRAIAIEQIAFGSDYTKLAVSYSNLASVERVLRNPEEARTLVQRAIAIEEKVYDADHPTLASSYAILATLENDLDNVDQARRLFRIAYDIRLKTLGQDHPSTKSAADWLRGLGEEL